MISSPRAATVSDPCVANSEQCCMLLLAVAGRGSRASVGARGFVCVACASPSRALALSRLSRPRVRAGASPSASRAVAARLARLARATANGNAPSDSPTTVHASSPRAPATPRPCTGTAHRQQQHGSRPTGTPILPARSHAHHARPRTATHTYADPPITPLGTFTSSLQEAPGSAAPRMQVPCHGDAMTDPDMLREGCCRVR